MLRRYFTLNLALILLTAIAIDSRAEDPQPPKHLAAATMLLKHLDLKQTSYDHGEGHVTWTGVCESHVDCSGFVNALLTHSYGYQPEEFKRWFGSHRPTAHRYHDAIVEQRGFVEIRRLKDALPGDLFAVKYLEKKANTGHIMLIGETPQKMASKDPIVPGTEQWAVSIIDSSESGHGPTDTRHARGEGGKDHQGLGSGIVRIYTDSQGSIAGFCWSTLGVSKFKAPREEHLVIGRLRSGFKP